MKYLPLLAILMLSCKIKSGRIYSVSYTPPHEETYQTLMYCGKTPIFQTHYRWVGDTTWYVSIERIKKGKKRRNTLKVSRETAISCTVGDTISFK
mgnify:CR=1 FL=1